jgi:hypothetical protein
VTSVQGRAIAGDFSLPVKSLLHQQYELYCKLSLLFDGSYVKRDNTKAGGKVMLVFELKAYGKQYQFNAVDEAIRTAKFIRNSCLRYWMDNKKVGRYDLNKYCAVLARDFHAR